LAAAVDRRHSIATAAAVDLPNRRCATTGGRSDMRRLNPYLCGFAAAYLFVLGLMLVGL
jgi:hypothetical protein